MSATVGHFHWSACEDCIHAEDGWPCEDVEKRSIVASKNDLICQDHRTQEDERERAAELRGDCVRDEA